MIDDEGYVMAMLMGTRFWYIGARIALTGQYLWTFYVKEASATELAEDLRTEAFDVEVVKRVEAKKILEKVTTISKSD